MVTEDPCDCGCLHRPTTFYFSGNRVEGSHTGLGYWMPGMLVMMEEDIAVAVVVADTGSQTGHTDFDPQIALTLEASLGHTFCQS